MNKRSQLLSNLHMRQRLRSKEIFFVTGSLCSHTDPADAD